MVTNCPYAGIHKWMKNIYQVFKYWDLWKHNGKTSNIEAPIDKIILKFWKYTLIWKISYDSILNYFTRYKCIVIQKDSWTNIHERFWCNFPTWSIRNVWRARDDGQHYDVTNICCGVTIATRSVEWTISLSKINVFFCCYEKLSIFKNTDGYPNKVWDKSKTTRAVWNCAINSPLRTQWGQKSFDLRPRNFCLRREPRGELIAQYQLPMSFRYKLLWWEVELKMQYIFLAKYYQLRDAGVGE